MRRALGWAGRALLALLATLALALGLFALRGRLAHYPVVPGPPAATGWVRGAFHVHTTRSDGAGSPGDVARAAREAGLDFVVLADHNDLQAAPARRQDGVLLVPGVELSTRHGHVVGVGMQRALGADAREGGVDAVHRAGGLAVLAHPVQRKNPWRDWDGSGRRADGLELYSADTFWRDALEAPLTRLVPGLGGYLGQARHGLMTIATARPGAHERLLAVASARPTAALCSHDAHGHPPYADVFGALALYLPAGALPPDPAEAAARVARALGDGEALCVLRALGEPDRFALEGLGPARTARVGEVLRVRLPTAPPGVLAVRTWGPARLEPDGTSVRLTGPGAVQVEVWVLAPGRLPGREWRPWLVPSPVRVLPRGAGF